MAFALKYYHDFKTAIKDVDITYRIEIFEEGYVGSSSEFEAGSTPIVIERINADMYEPIRKSTATVNFWNTTNNQFSEFLTASYGTYQIKLVQDPTGTADVKWIGFNQSEIVTEPYLQAPYNTAVKFTCGLSHLAYIPFDNSGTLYEGYKSLIEVLRLCTNKLPTALPYYEAVNIYEDDMNKLTVDSMLAQCLVNVQLYQEINDKVEPNVVEAWSCYDVIKAILAPFKAHIYQWDNEWRVVRVQEYNTDISNLYYRRFNANVGTESTLTVASSGNESLTYAITDVDKGNTDELVFLGDSAEQELLAPLNKILLNYVESDEGVTGSILSLIKNPFFGVVSYQYLWLWTAVNFDDTAYNSIYFYDNKRWFTYSDSVLASSYNHDTATYITQTKAGVPFTLGDNLKLTLSVRSYLTVSSYDNTEWADVNLNTASYYSYIPVEIKLGNYYLVGNHIDGLSASTSTSASWSLTQGYFLIKVKSYSSYTVGATKNGTNTRYLEAQLPTIPATALGDAVVKVYPPYTNTDVFNATHTTQLAIGDYFISDFDLIYTAQGETETIEAITLYTEIDEDVNIYEEDLVHADGQLGLSLNAFRVDTGGVYPELTNLWDRRGYTDGLTLMELISRQLVDMRGDFVRAISADLVGKINAYNTITYTIGGTITWYYMNNFKWDVRGQVWQVELIQLEDLTSVTPPIFGDPTYKINPIIEVVEPAPVAFVDESYISKSKISLSNSGRLITNSTTDTVNYI